jgi:hypothetical protein
MISARLKEGILIAFLGLAGIIGVNGSFSQAGEFVTSMLYIQLILFIAIAIIGITIIKDSIK